MYPANVAIGAVQLLCDQPPKAHVDLNAPLVVCCSAHFETLGIGRVRLACVAHDGNWALEQRRQNTSGHA